MPHTPEPNQPPVQTWDSFCQAFADFFVSRITTDEIRELSFAIRNDIDSRLFVDKTPQIPNQEKENDNEHNTQS
jgi:hypothetical protein